MLTSMSLKFLVIVPHPDDEVYGASGTIMDYLDEGQNCGLVTLTRGEAGRTLGLCDGPDELMRMREVELAACLETIGLTTHPGSVHEQYQFPDKYLKDADFGAICDTVRDTLERLKPEIVLTFPPNGSNGHPDHVTTHRAVKAVWDTLDPGTRPELWYYAGYTPPENEALRADWLLPNLERDVSRWTTRKLQAIACHRSQALSTVDFIRKFPERITSETFYRVE